MYDVGNLHVLVMAQTVGCFKSEYLRLSSRPHSDPKAAPDGVFTFTVVFFIFVTENASGVGRTRLGVLYKQVDSGLPEPSWRDERSEGSCCCSPTDELHQ